MRRPYNQQPIVQQAEYFKRFETSPSGRRVNFTYVRFVLRDRTARDTLVAPDRIELPTFPVKVTRVYRRAALTN